jgi:hypothetical protein
MTMGGTGSSIDAFSHNQRGGRKRLQNNTGEVDDLARIVNRIRLDARVI